MRSFTPVQRAIAVKWGGIVLNGSLAGWNLAIGKPANYVAAGIIIALGVFSARMSTKAIFHTRQLEDYRQLQSRIVEVRDLQQEGRTIEAAVLMGEIRRDMQTVEGRERP